MKRIDIIELLLANELGGRRAPGISISDVIDAIVGGPKEDTDHINEAVNIMIEEGTMALLKPITTRSRIEIGPDILYIGPEGFHPDHPHVNILTRHPKPEKRDHWRLWSFCPSSSVTYAFKFRGIPDLDQAERIANLIMDIGLGKYPEGELEEIIIAERRKKRAAGATH
jgi:hypothetical protein